VIFVTVGTHEQPFDRLFYELAAIKRQRPELEFFCQHGVSRGHPELPGAPFVAFDKMERLIADADAVITHGGPGSILPVLAARKPIVLVPRIRAFGEHVDDHQVAFCTRIAEAHEIELVTDIAELGTALRSARPPRHATTDGSEESISRLSRLIEGYPRIPTRWARRASRRSP
jgi:UDP-N-acetylglucosamine transferase subunit ALG13